MRGTVHDAAGAPVVGAVVTVSQGDPSWARSVFSDDAGAFRVSGMPDGPLKLRVRRVGWKPYVEESAPPVVDVVLERETDPAAVAEQLPADRWYHLLLERIDNPHYREVLVRQCTFCHQQGSWATRRQRDPEEWKKILLLMGRKGAFLPNQLREELPALFNAAYDPKNAVPELTAGLGTPAFEPPPPPEVRRAVIDEWQLGDGGSMMHDIVMHPDGRLYAVDMDEDALYRLDVSGPEPIRKAWKFPDAGLPVGGMFATKDDKASSGGSHVGPHSIQVAPDGSLWATLAIGNRLARFDPKTEKFTLVKTHEGWYPHTLRFDQRGRIWYTLAASNHVGMYDPKTGEQKTIRLPTRNLTQAVAMRFLPFFMWLGRHIDLRGDAAGAGEGMEMPVPYGIDVSPDGVVWLSQLNEHRIVRVDPDTFDLQVVETPFFGPRRLRFDSKGYLWIPGFSSDVISRFDPRTHTFKTWDLPTGPKGSDAPYALNVDKRTDTVWICGTNSDTLVRFQPDTERFTVYPLPTRVTFTRELDFDAEGRVWTSNSNSPTWQIEGGYPRVLRLDPGGLDRPGPVAQAGSAR